jgi:hypothetical protein
LVAHFKSAKVDENRDRTERSLYEGLLRKITNIDFVLDLALMCDVLQELAELSTELQARDITLYSVHRKITNQLKLFDERNTNMGPHYLEALKAEKGLEFKGVSLENGARYRQGNHIDPVKFYESLKARMESRLLARDFTNKNKNQIEININYNNKKIILKLLINNFSV